MPLSTQVYKGARDFYPEDKQVQDYMFGIMRQVAKNYGYSEYDAPILESLDLYRAKSGDEIVSEQTYSFTDRGGREVAIRPDMTPTVSRMVAARRHELVYPLRWFSIPNLWRYERPQRGRLREHWQLNVDIFGDDTVAAEHEIISFADSLLKAYGAKPSMYEIRLNSRVLMDQLMHGYLGLNKDKSLALSKLIDKMFKINPQKYSESLDEICMGLPEGTRTKIELLLAVKSLGELPEEVQDHRAVVRLKDLIELLNETCEAQVKFDISIMRGFDYYTDVVFEVFDTDPENNRSMFGGGRYDGLVGLFGVEPLPVVGFGMGDVTLLNFLKSHDLLPELKSATDLHLLLIGDVYAGATKLASQLRQEGLNVSIDATDRKLDKKIKSADKQGAKYVLFVGDDELSKNQFTLRDLTKGSEDKLAAGQIIDHLKTT